MESQECRSTQLIPRMRYHHLQGAGDQNFGTFTSVSAYS